MMRVFCSSSSFSGSAAAAGCNGSQGTITRDTGHLMLALVFAVLHWSATGTSLLKVFENKTKGSKHLAFLWLFCALQKGGYSAQEPSIHMDLFLLASKYFKHRAIRLPNKAPIRLSGAIQIHSVYVELGGRLLERGDVVISGNKVLDSNLSTSTPLTPPPFGLLTDGLQHPC
mmetsp:Transcript_37444/g.60637  ORF Transcript_37444/g.60637 Transcript_37444/m.60637 type:complete len:172 (-) Transcript_37444:1108-1623(-)